MAEMSRRFNFDDFDGQIAEALEANEQAMEPVRNPRPGEIGGVVVKLSWCYNADGEYTYSPPDDAA